MKTRIVSLIFIYSLVLLFAGNIMAQDGIEEELFNEAFPELKGELIKPEKQDLSADEVKELRDVLTKLDNAISNDLNAFKYGALTPENSLVFEYKRLKKAKKNLDIEKLEKLITAEKRKIRVYMGDKAKYGSDPDECKRNIALFQQATKANKLKEAYKYWNVLFHYYPRSTKMIYSKGSDIIEFKYEQTKDDKWVDTLMLLYDQRIKFKFFGSNDEYPEGYILGRKATDLLKHKKEDVEDAYPIFEKSVKLQGVNSEDPVLLSFMQATEGMFVKKKIDAAEVVDNYTHLSALLEERVKNPKENPLAEQAMGGVTHIFLKSEASTCEQLIPAFQKRFDKNKNDVDQLEKIARMLSMKDCTDSDLFSDVAIAIDKLRPSALSKYALAMRFARNKEYEQASDYMNQSIKLETVDSIKAKNYYKLAYFSNELGKKSEAKANALKAISLKGNYGAPYILIATMYAASGCSQLTSPEATLARVAYWAAVDKLIQAKSVEPELASDVNRLISSYSGRFPNKEEAFMQGITKGKRVTIGCWINETTTVR